MPPKGKKGRGKSVNINEFNEDFIPEEALDWAEDDWLTPEQAQQAKLTEKLAAKQERPEYSRVANNAFDQQESFRTTAHMKQDSKFLIDGLQPPYVAHFGNLRNGTTEEDFLTLFNRAAIVTHRLINQEGKTFAFVEFDSVNALAIALTLDQTFQRGRRMYVDLATQKQIERLLNIGGERAGFSRESAGQQQPGGFNGMALSRDAFGANQPTDDGMPGSRSGYGSRMDLHSLNDFSRDLLGSAVQAPPSTASPTGVGSPANFANWRSEDPATQPDFPRATEEAVEPRGIPKRGSTAGLGAGGGDTATEGRAALFGGGTTSWRDEPRAEAPKMEDGPAGSPTNPPTRGGRGGGGMGRGGGTGGMGRGGGATERGNPAVLRAPAAPVGDKWAELRR